MVNTQKSTKLVQAPGSSTKPVQSTKLVQNTALQSAAAATVAPTQQSGKAAPTAAALAAVKAAQLAASAANQGQAPASPAQAAAQAAHVAAKPKAGSAGGTYKPTSIGAQIAAACDALAVLHPNTVPTAGAVLLHMPTVVVAGVVTPLNKASASCGVSHWRKAQGKLRVKAA